METLFAVLKVGLGVVFLFLVLLLGNAWGYHEALGDVRECLPDMGRPAPGAYPSTKCLRLAGH